jgi:hypothetical protein
MSIKKFDEFKQNIEEQEVNESFYSLHSIASQAADKLNEVRTILDARFREDLTDKEFDKLQTVYDYVCKALEQIL